nr:hypothetical protein [uncultured Dyadobacter sp.]
MILSRIVELEATHQAVESDPDKEFVCQILYDGGAKDEGFVVAKDETDATIKVYQNLVHQGVAEIVLEITSTIQGSN